MKVKKILDEGYLLNSITIRNIFNQKIEIKVLRIKTLLNYTPF